MNRTPRYWVLALSEQPTRLFEGVRHPGRNSSRRLPDDARRAGRRRPLPGGFGVNPSAHRDERHRQFFRSVDAALKPFLAERPAAAGRGRRGSLPGLLGRGLDAQGIHARDPARQLRSCLCHELAKAVWPLVQATQAERVQRHLDELDGYVSQARVASTVGEAWRKANEGRGKLLLVEQDYHEAGRWTSPGCCSCPWTIPARSDVIPDAVDEVIEMVLSKGGEVVFTENGQLAAYQRIALVLRY
jgi:hypothetical protein